jgi:hypothetical protein
MPQDCKTIRCRWIFRLKIDSKKSCSVVRGYKQEPGVDYVETYSTLATNTTINVALAELLYLQKSHEDWVMDMVDVEAAFLTALVDTDMYIKLPEGLREYMQMQGIELDNNTVIKLSRAQYGLVQCPRLWMETFSYILTSLGLNQCKTYPCLFCLFDKDGNQLVMVVVHCDKCTIAGRSKWVIQIKIGISGQMKILDLGN